MSARPGPCGGRSAMIVPTAISLSNVVTLISVVGYLKATEWTLSLDLIGLGGIVRLNYG